MSKGLSYNFSGTKGDVVAIANSLPQNGAGVESQGWKDISHPDQAAHGHYTYEDPKTGLRIRYDTPTPGASGFAGKDHFHILNPNATGNSDLYLDKYGNPVRKNSKASHILPARKEDE